MRYLIIDTNVPLKASNLHPEDEIDRKCSKACFSFIDNLMNSDDIVVLDENREILKEYESNINIHLEDSVASEFLMWLYHQIRSNAVQQCRLHKICKDTYEEFPDSPELEGFDRSDRKFVALANTHSAHPNIYNGSDTDWWYYKDALSRVGIHVIFLCEEYMLAKKK